MPLWKMEQITPYLERKDNHTKHNPLGAKLVRDCLTNSEIGIITFIEKGGSHKEETITAPTIIAHTIAKHSVYREENPDIYSYEKAAEALYKIYWSNLPFWGRFHRRAYKWSLPTIAGSLVGSLILLLIEAIMLY